MFFSVVVLEKLFEKTKIKGGGRLGKRWKGHHAYIKPELSSAQSTHWSQFFYEVSRYHISRYKTQLRIIPPHLEKPTFMVLCTLIFEWKAQKTIIPVGLIWRNTVLNPIPTGQGRNQPIYSLMRKKTDKSMSWPFYDPL